MAQRFKRPESVLVVVYTVLGEVLVLRRVWPADFWQSVTGSLRWDEADPLITARRELWEETGLDEAVEVEVIDCKISNRFPILPAWRHRYGNASENVEYVFRTQLPGRVPIRLNPQEHSEYLWLARKAAAERVTSYTNREAILRFVPFD